MRAWFKDLKKNIHLFINSIQQNYFKSDILFYLNQKHKNYKRQNIFKADFQQISPGCFEGKSTNAGYS